MGITAIKKLHNPHQPTGTWITPKRRLAIYLRDSFACVYCLRDMHSADPRDVTLDHLACKVDGGTNHEANLVLACRSCNSARADKTLVAFAGPETRKMIRRNVRRSLRPYLVLAAALISGKTDDNA